MADKYIQVPPGGDGGGGGGSGDVNGPGSSTLDSVPRFADTTGKLLGDTGVTISDLDQLYVPNTAVARPGLFGVVPQILLSPTEDTGIAYDTFFSGRTITFALNGRQAMRIQADNGNPTPGIIMLGTTYPDPTGGPYSLGFTTRYWEQGYIGQLHVSPAITAGSLAQGDGLIMMYNTPGTGYGIGMNSIDPDTDGRGRLSTIYFRLNDWASNESVFENAFNVQYSAGITTVRANDTQDSVSATNPGTLLLRGGNSTGSAPGGDTLLSAGTSSSGAPGNVYMPVTSGAPSDTPTAHTGFAPFKVDPATGKLYVYGSGVWTPVGSSPTSAPVVITGATGTTTIDFASGNNTNWNINVVGNISVVFTNPVPGCTARLRIFQDATGSRSVSFPGNLFWPGSTPFTPSGANAMDEVLIDYDGTNYFAMANTDYAPPVPLVDTNSILFVAASSQYVDFGNVFGFDRTDSYSFSAWIKPATTSGAPQIVGKESASGTNPGYNFGMLSAKLYAQLLGTNGTYIDVRGSTVLTAGTWYQVALTYDGSGVAAGIKLYVNGVLETPTVAHDNLTTSIVNSASFAIGTLVGQGVYFDGHIDEVVVYNAAIASGTALALYNFGTPVNPTGISDAGSIVSWYRMGDPSDSVTTSNGVLDRVGSHNGTGTNMISANITTDVP